MGYTSAETGEKGATVEQVREALDLLLASIAATNAANAVAFRSATFANNIISFFTNPNGTGEAAATLDLPGEMFLDQAKTRFVDSFAFDTTTYEGATNPNLEGKPVFVLAVKGDGATVNYSFVDMSALVDTYSAADNSVTVNGFKIGVNISATAGNALTLTPNGLFVPAAPEMATEAEFDEMLRDVGLLPADSGDENGNSGSGEEAGA